METKIADLRSDTVTQPSDEMREAMTRAEVGDDVYGEDPSINRLENEVASLVGKEAALFMPSGIMGNLIAVLTHTSRGDAVILDPEAHIFYYEAGGSSLVGGLQLWPVTDLHTAEGLQNFKKELRPDDIHFAPARLLCLENSHNRKGGTVLKPEEQDAFYEAAREAGLSVHLDGARIFNAALALDCPVTALTRSCDSVMFCLSKGLGAPVGSMVAGTREFIEKARKNRKLMGGGMRQAGILAAAGLIALKQIPDLSADHLRALRLAEGLFGIPGLKITPFPPPTNIVIMNTEDLGLSATEFISKLQPYGVKAAYFGENLVRMVTHRDIDDNNIEQALIAVKEICSGYSG